MTLSFSSNDLKMEDLIDKEDSIKHIVKIITNRNRDIETVNFWDSDNCAIGLRRNNKLIYISICGFSLLPPDEMKYYVVFELLKDNSLLDKISEITFDGISEDALLQEIDAFLK